MVGKIEKKYSVDKIILIKYKTLNVTYCNVVDSTYIDMCNYYV